MIKLFQMFISFHSEQISTAVAGRSAIIHIFINLDIYLILIKIYEDVINTVDGALITTSAGLPIRCLAFILIFLFV